MDMPKCEAHNIMERELNRIKDNQSELYSLDRQRQKDNAEMAADLREIKTEQQVMKKDITELKTSMSEVNDRVNTMDNKMDKMGSDISNLNTVVTNINQKVNQMTENKKWQPKDMALIVVAALSMTGVIVSAILTYLK